VGKNLSIRTRILAGLVTINLLGMVVVMIYLHQSYSGSLDTTISNTGTQGLAAWEEIKGMDVSLDPVTQPAEAVKVIESMKAVTGADYAILIDKAATDQAAYTAARETLNEPSAWAEGDTYALLAATNPAMADKITFNVPPAEVPENSKVVGVEVGACTRTCHDGISGEGDYWTIRWSTDSSSRGHAVFPIFGAGADPIGVIYVEEDITKQAEAANKGIMQTLFTVALTLIVATLTLGALLDLLVLKRLNKMTKSIQEISMRLAGGDFNAHYEPDGTTDEIGSFEKFFSDFINLISITLKQLSGQK
jgi:HAMP domain-containing protein